MIIINRHKSTIVTVDILYWMPDYHNLVQTFLWQTLDIKPGYPRVNRFLNFWKNEIDAVIKEIYLMDSDGSDIRNSFEIGDIKAYASRPI